MNNATRTETAALTVGTRVQLVKGCKARGLDKGITARIDSVTKLGADYSHAVQVVLQPLNGFKAGKRVSFFARHINRLSDAIVRMNDGNPSNTIEVRRVGAPPSKPAIERVVEAEPIAPVSSPEPASAPSTVHAYAVTANGGRRRSFDAPGGFQVYVEPKEDDAAQAAFTAWLANAAKAYVS